MNYVSMAIITVPAKSSTVAMSAIINESLIDFPTLKNVEYAYRLKSPHNHHTCPVQVVVAGTVCWCQPSGSRNRRICRHSYGNILNGRVLCSPDHSLCGKGATVLWQGRGNESDMIVRDIYKYARSEFHGSLPDQNDIAISFISCAMGPSI